MITFGDFCFCTLQYQPYRTVAPTFCNMIERTKIHNNGIIVFSTSMSVLLRFDYSKWLVPFLMLQKIAQFSTSSITGYDFTPSSHPALTFPAIHILQIMQHCCESD